MSKKNVSMLFLSLLLPLVFLACSSGGGGGGGSSDPGNTGNASALVVADKVSVVDAKLSGSVAAVAPLKIGLFRVAATDLAATSDYKVDKTQVWVSERSAEAFETINNILCMMAQTKYSEMLNKGDYVALVDENQCSSEKSDASSAAQDSQNQSSSSNMPDYMTFVVNSSRADNNSSQLGKIWVHEKANPQHQEPEKLIFVKIVITEGKSDTNPYGLFKMDFIGYPATNGVPDMSAWKFKGVLKSEKNAAGEVLLKFAEQDQGQWAGSTKVTLNRKGDGSGGSGSVASSHTEMQNNTSTVVSNNLDIAFDTNYFLRKEGANTVCLNRSVFEESAWRYGLYDSTGKRLNRNSGFSVNTKADGTGSHGFVGYWGLWLDNNASIIDNKLYKYDYSTTTATPYAVFRAGGKLKKHTKKAMQLGEIRGIPLDYWEQSSNGGMNYRVVWDGANFNKVAYMGQCSNNTPCTWTDMASGQTISFGNLQWGELNFWSQSLGGQVRVPLAGCVQTPPPPCNPGPGVMCQGPITTCTPPDNNLNIVYFAEDIVYPTDTVPPVLECFDNCPNAPTAAGVDLTVNNGYVTNMMSGPSNTPVDYAFATASMNLTLNGNPVILTSIPQASQNQWGINSGPLFDPADRSRLACDYPDMNGNYGICGWKAWSVLDVFYTWETGPNNWNQFTALQDIASGATLTFEAPLQVKYVHNKAPYAGATFMMDYSGFGQLNGIPGKCVNMDTGANVDCSTGGPGSPVRWVPAFVIPPTQADGSLTTVSVNAVNYYVKPLEMEQRMIKDDTGCTGLTTNDYSSQFLSITTDWTDPALGQEPTVTAPPAVIGGMVQ